MNKYYSRKNIYSLSLTGDRILKSLSCPIFKTHFSHKTTESAGRCWPPLSHQKAAGWTLLLWPSPTWASLNFQLSCCAICSPVPAQLLGSRLAAWHTGWSRAACTGPRRQGRELPSITTLKCWQKSIFIPAPENLHSKPHGAGRYIFHFWGLSFCTGVVHILLQSFM